MKRRGAALLVCVLACTSSRSADAIDCKAFADSIDRSQRVLAMLAAEARWSRTPESINQRIQHELTLMHINVTLAAGRCSITAPVAMDRYSSAAAQCQRDLIREGGGNPPSCDWSKWTPD